MSNKKPFKVYFDLNGNLLNRLYYWDQKNGNFKEEDNHIFADQLEYVGYSSPHIKFKSLISGRIYLMFISDFDKMILEKKMQNNIIEGEFTFTRKGIVQGFKMLLPKKQSV